MVHISEVSGSFVTDVHDFLTEGQEVPVKVLSISPEGKISLSVKQAQPPKPRPQYADRPARPRPPRPNPARPNPSQPAAPPAELTFEDKLKQFMSVVRQQAVGAEPVYGLQARRPPAEVEIK